MAQRPQNFPVQYRKDQSGCMWGFISIFDFRHGRSTRKMIGDAKRSGKHAVDAVPTKNKFETLSNLDEEYEGNFEKGGSKRLTMITDVDKPSMKKLIEEEMFVDQDAMKDLGNAEVESKKSRLGCEDYLNTDSKRRKKSRKKSRGMETHDLNLDATLKSEFSHNQHSRQESKDNLDLDKIIEDFRHIKGAYSVMHDNDGEDNAQSNQKHGVSENLARDAIHEFVNQMILNGKGLAEDRKLLCSNELMEALEVISSDKDLLLRLLQDSDSLLLKYVQELGNAQGKNDKEYGSAIGSKLSDHEDLGNLKQSNEIVTPKHCSFLRKKVKSQSKFPTDENGKTEFPNRIVILKPALPGFRNSESENIPASSLDSHDVVHYKGPSVRASSHFSLTEIKKKLKHAMGKERHGNLEGISRKLADDHQNKGSGSKAIDKDNIGMRSPNKDHFFFEKIARPMLDVMKGNKSKASEDAEFIVEHENGCSNSTQRVSNLYIEAKKHLCEMLDNEDENTNISSRHSPKTLGRILALPEYNFSPFGSPGRDLEHHFVTAHTRFSTSDKTWEFNEDNFSPKQATFIGHPGEASSNSQKHSSICDEISEVQEINSQSSFKLDLGHVDVVQTRSPIGDEIVTEVNVESSEEQNPFESSSVIGFTAGKNQYHDTSEIPEDARDSSCLNQDATKENQLSSLPLSPSHTSIAKTIEELDSGADVSGRPSPVSVLDPPFLDDEFSPGYSRCQSVKLAVRPLQIEFEDHDSSPVDELDRGKYCLEENELIYDYVKAVLQASCLTIDRLLMKCLSSDTMLNPSLFDQVEFFSNPRCHNQKLLFDCIDEVLMEVCWYYFGVSPCVSFVNPSIRPTPNMKKVVFKVWEGVCWHILPLPPPHTLEQIVRKDMAGSQTWMDLRPDAEAVGFEMGETLLAELMEDTILSFVSESLESKCSLLQFELEDNERSGIKL